MKAPPLSIVSSLFHASSKGAITQHKVHDQEFLDFSASLNDLLREVGPDAGDPAWLPIVRWLKSFRFAASTTPLPFSHFRNHCVRAREDLDPALSQLALTAPAQMPHLDALFQQVTSLTASERAPLLDAAQTLEMSEGPAAGLVKEHRFLQCSSQHAMHSLPGISDWLSGRRIREVASWNHLLVFGPSSWYPTFLLAAPRAQAIHVISYAWIKDRIKVEPLLTTGDSKKRTRRPKPSTVEHGSSDAPRRFSLKDEDLLPGLDRDTMHQVAKAHAKHASDSEPARLVILEGDEGVYLPADDKAKTFVIEVGEAGQLEVVSLPVRSLQPDSYIVLRTEGGGDYIRELADEQMGEEGRILRHSQRLWKEMLSQAVLELGEDEVIRRLIEAGVSHADEGNVRNWLGERNLRPYRIENLQAILALRGEEQRTESIWEHLMALQTAHTRAGQTIRQILVDAIENSDPDELDRTGLVTFEIDGGGSLTAYRILQIDAQEVEVARSAIGLPFPLD